jgi:hypothetical protein
MTMKKAALTAVLILLFAGAASAGETGIINQSGPYEATMKFYLHPAHGFPGTPETTPMATSVSEDANTSQARKTSKQSSAKMVAAHSSHQDVKTRVSADLHFDP